MPGQGNLDFEHNGVRFSVIHLPGMDRVQLRVWASDHVGWELIHGRDIPKGMTPAKASAVMHDFITGRLTLDDYTDLLPGD